MLTDPPADALAAVTHPDPAAYYAELAGRPMHRDEHLGAWVAATPSDVLAVLAHPAARVRPPASPVPAHLAGTIAGEAFAALPRMSDGADHAPRRAEIEHLLASFAPHRIADACLAASRRCDGTPAGWQRAFPVAVLAELLELDLPLDDIVASAAALAAAFGPAGDASHVAAAEAAVEALPPAAVCLVFQAADAMAGLVGLALAGDDLPAVHNTRRWFHEPATVAGCDVATGDIVLVVLAAAGMPFGAGPHRCPAEALATSIAVHAAAGAAPAPRPVGHLRSPNVRIPTFPQQEDR